MTLTLRAMTQPEFSVFTEHAIEDYAQDHVVSGDWASEEAVQKSRGEFDQLLPDGLHSADQLFFTAEVAGDPVGILWLGLRMRGTQRAAWIYDIIVDADQRGHGYGRALLAAAEDAARDAGAASLGLNVFGANTVARRLYESAGYEITSQQMRKPL